jgi:hypothetical protein
MCASWLRSSSSVWASEALHLFARTCCSFSCCDVQTCRLVSYSNENGSSAVAVNTTLPCSSGRFRMTAAAASSLHVRRRCSTALCPCAAMQLNAKFAENRPRRLRIRSIRSRSIGSIRRARRAIFALHQLFLCFINLRIRALLSGAPVHKTTPPCLTKTTIQNQQHT